MAADPPERHFAPWKMSALGGHVLLQWAVLLRPGGQAVPIHVYIHIHISIYLHIFAYLYTYMHIYLHTYTYLSIYTYMYTFIYLYKYIYIHIFIYISIYIIHEDLYTYIYIYTFVPTCSSMVLPGGQGGAADPQERAQGGAADPLAAAQCRPGPYSGSDGTRGNRRKQSRAASPFTMLVVCSRPKWRAGASW